MTRRIFIGPLTTAIVLAALLLPRDATGQIAAFRALPDTVRAGEPFTLVVVARYPDVMDVILPRSSADEPARLGDVVLLGLSDRSVSREAGGIVRDSIVFEAAVFVADSARTGPSELLLRSPSDTARVELPIHVLPVRRTVAPGTEPRDITPIFRAPVNPVWFAGGVLLLLVIGVATYLLMRRRKRPAEEERRELLGPLDEAMQALRELEGSSAHTLEQERLFVIRLSEILRQYIARGLHVPAQERTSAELLHDLSRDPRLSASSLDALKPILITIDGVKFAAASLPDERQNLLERVRAWIMDAERQVRETVVEASPSVDA